MIVEQFFVVAELQDSEEIGKIVKHNNHWSFLSDTRQSSTSEQSLLGIKLEDSDENQKHSEI